MIVGFVALLAITLAPLYWRARPGWKKTGPYLPDSFLAGLALFAVGSALNLLDAPSQATEDVALMGWIALCSALAGALVSALVTRHRGTYHDLVAGLTNPPRAELLLIKSGLLLSSVVCLGFIYAVINSAPLSALLSFASLASDNTSLLTARKAITAGTAGYFAPGYVKQFRDILIPVLLSALVATNRRYLKSILFWAVAAVALVAMLITGQRFILLVAVATVFLASHLVARFRLRALLVIGTTTLAAYGAVTVLLGRLPEGTTPLQAVGAIGANLIDRSVLTVPRENALTYPVWSAPGPTMGGSWLDDASALLPGGPRQHLSNLLHSTAGGSEEGNSPLGLPVDTWLAWGWVGLVGLPFVFSIALGVLDQLLSRRSAVLFAVKVYLLLTIPIFYSPYLFVLYGGAIALILAVSIHLIHSARRTRYRRRTPSAPISGGTRGIARGMVR